MRKMSRNALTLVAGLIVATFGATPALAVDPTVGVLYDIDFTGETLDSPPGTHAAVAAAPRNQVSNVFDENANNSINVVAAHGTLTDKPLRFDAFGPVDRNNVILDMDDFPGGLPANAFYVLEADVYLDSGPGPNTALSFRFRNPALFNFLVLNFSQAGLVLTGRGGSVLHSDTFAFNTKISFRMELDLASDTYRVFLDGALFDSGSFQIGDTTGGIEFIAFSVGSGTAGGNMTAAVDNVLVTAAFGPPPPTELAACSWDAATLEANCTASGGGVAVRHKALGAVVAVPEDCKCPVTVSTPAIVSTPCTDLPGAADACFNPATDFITTPSEESIVHVEGGIGTHISTTYCYAIGRFRICQNYEVAH